MSGPFSWGKLLSSPFTGMYWIKVIMFAFGMSFIGMVGWAFYKAYFAKPAETQQQVNSIQAQPGSTINIGQKADSSGRDFFAEPFVEGLYDITGDSAFEGKVGIRLGMRF